MKFTRAKPQIERKRSSSQQYQTFPTPPPKSKGNPLSASPPTSENNFRHHARHASNQSNRSQQNESPLPTRQLAVLAVIALSEQTALNSISPYLPQMASTFPEVDPGQVGVYVGTIASSFALAQLTTNFFWGWLSDKIGRKPVILMGTFLTSVCFVAFGFCRTLWQAVLVQALMGMVNGNQGVVSTCLGEITDRSNQSKAFTYLPVIYGLGGITGPVVGGLLVQKIHPGNPSGSGRGYPYLAPNLVSAGVLVVDMIITMLFLEESLEEAKDLPPLGKRMGSLFSWVWQFASSTRPSYLRNTKEGGGGQHHHRHRNSVSEQNVDGAVDDEEEEDTSDSDDDSSSQISVPLLLPQSTAHLGSKQILTRDTLLLLSTYLIFQLSNISYNSLYPIFAQADPPTGRHLSPEEIGLSLAFAGAVTILFQVVIFGKLREKMGNRTTYRVSLAGFVVAFMLMPWVGYKKSQNGDGSIMDGKIWLWTELGFVLLVKTVAAVAGLTSALLMITNSAPTPSVLGTLNGIAQTLSAAGRAIGPFLSGGLFSLATRVQPKGEALAFGVFGGIAFIGFMLSFGIRGQGLEAEGWDDAEGSEDGEEEEDETDVER
ncbi:hypothetical protein MMC25_004938 [Agyrium rufum]|nr:hypothetical protein [Agyrium rufum]